MTAELLAGQLVAAAAALTATGVIWRKAVRPLIGALRAFVDGTERLSGALPTLIEIGEQFRPDSGSTLYDIIGEIRDTSQQTAHSNSVLVAKFDAYAVENDHDRGRLWAAVAELNPTLDRRKQIEP